MSIDTFQLATEGVGPGFTTYSVAALGYTIEVVPTPSGFTYPNQSGGTGSGNIASTYGYVPYRPREKLAVKISRNGKEWEEEFEEIDVPLFLKDSELVEAAFLGVRPVGTTATFIKYMINTDNVIIKVKKL